MWCHEEEYNIMERNNDTENITTEENINCTEKGFYNYLLNNSWYFLFSS